MVKIKEKTPIIAYKGEVFTVECAIRLNGSSESKEFIDCLENKEKAKIFRVIKKFADVGHVFNKDQFKKVEDVLWEFKASQIRILMFHCAYQRIALTHGFYKKTQKIPRSEIDRGNRIVKEYNKVRKEKGWQNV